MTAQPTRRPMRTPAPTRRPRRTPSPTRRPRRTPAPTGMPIRTPAPTRRPMRTPVPTQRPVQTMEPSGRPTRQPVTIRPTALPTLAPTSPPSRRPVVTSSPTSRPSSPPTGEPGIMPVVTSEPTSGAPTQTPGTARPTPTLVCNPPISELEREQQLFDIVSTVSNPLSLFNPETPQFDAFFWLLNVDDAQVCPENELDVIQRYVAALLYITTSGNQWNQCSALNIPNPSPCASVRWLSADSVCTWFGVSCDEGNNEIQSILLGKSSFALKYMFLTDTSIRTSAHGNHLLPRDRTFRREQSLGISSTRAQLAFSTSSSEFRWEHQPVIDNPLDFRHAGLVGGAAIAGERV